MKQVILLMSLVLTLTTLKSQILGKTNLKTYNGFFNFYYEDATGKLFLEVDKLDEEFLYVNALATGVGSNDIGLDRGKLGETQIVKFIKRGDKLLLIQPNLNFRANTTNKQEQLSVQQAFAFSVLYGFEIENETNGKYIIDLTPFLMEDVFGVIDVFKTNEEGTYKIDKTKSALALERTKSFPNNSEFEALITFSGDPKGMYLRQVAPNPKLVSVIQHHSFIKLPDANYKPRVFNPRSGAFFISYLDYASPIDEPIKKRLLVRHRLEKKNPELPLSEPVEPIIYYLDPGTPEPIRSALLDGAKWWAEAFEAAGFKNAFKVKMLPPDADLMDSRYNVIQWVHRSTRGWSYGASVVDPRTGEIIKGHVSLGSLRVRQDYLIAQALSNSPFKTTDANTSAMLNMALARLRQLSAHEVGHTLGLAHNFAASAKSDASVMDYPHPKITKTAADIDISKAYDTQIGAWDKIAISYSYAEFSSNETEKLNAILDKADADGFQFISDYDARSQGGSHAVAHLWDNGENPATELNRVLELRKQAIANFSEENIPFHTTYSDLEDVFVPVYFFHRYQTEAAVKQIGGEQYNYRVRGTAQDGPKPIKPDMQRMALQAVLNTLKADNLAIPKAKLELFPPRAYGYNRNRESFKSELSVSFDAFGAVATASDFTLDLLLHPSRANRLVQQHSLFANQLSLEETLTALINTTFKQSHSDLYLQEVQNTIRFNTLQHFFKLATSNRAKPQVKAAVYAALNKVESVLSSNLSFDAYLLSELNRFKTKPESFSFNSAPEIPAGSPIGSNFCSTGSIQQ